jgi:hypothetical protein
LEEFTITLHRIEDDRAPFRTLRAMSRAYSYAANSHASQLAANDSSLSAEWGHD